MQELNFVSVRSNTLLVNKEMMVTVSSLFPAVLSKALFFKSVNLLPNSDYF